MPTLPAAWGHYASWSLERCWYPRILQIHSNIRQGSRTLIYPYKKPSYRQVFSGIICIGINDNIALDTQLKLRYFYTMTRHQKFGKKLRLLRKASNMTQRELAEKVGIDFTYMSKIENDRLPPPKRETIVEIARALEADENELVVLAGKIPKDYEDEIVGEDDTARRLLGSFRSGIKSGLSKTDMEELLGSWTGMLERKKKEKNKKKK